MTKIDEQKMQEIARLKATAHNPNAKPFERGCAKRELAAVVRSLGFIRTRRRAYLPSCF